MERIEAILWVGSALGLSYGRAAALMTREEQRIACRMLSQAKRKGRRPWPVPAAFLKKLKERKDGLH